MLFRSCKPVPPLSDFIENFWLYDGYSCAHAHERIFPTGTFELVFNLRNDELRIYEDSKSLLRSRYSGALVSGPYNGFFVTDRAEGASVMGVHFRPGGAFSFLGLSVYELANAHTDLATIFMGEVEGESTVRALQLQRDDKSASLVSMQRFRGKLGGRQGTFVLQGSETVQNGKITATWVVVPGSGTGDLSGLRGEGGFAGDFGKGSDATLNYWFE